MELKFVAVVSLLFQFSSSSSSSSFLLLKHVNNFYLPRESKECEGVLKF